MKFKANYAAYKNLFYPIYKAAALPQGETNLENEMTDTVPFSGGPFKIDSWSPEQLVLVPNPNSGTRPRRRSSTRSSWCPRTPTLRSTRCSPARST